MKSYIAFSSSISTCTDCTISNDMCQPVNVHVICICTVNTVVCPACTDSLKQQMQSTSRLCRQVLPWQQHLASARGSNSSTSETRAFPCHLTTLKLIASKYHTGWVVCSSISPVHLIVAFLICV